MKTKIRKIMGLLVGVMLVLGCSITSFAASTVTRTGTVTSVTVDSNGTGQSDNYIKDYIRNHSTFKATFNKNADGTALVGKPIKTTLKPSTDKAVYSEHTVIDAGKTSMVTYDYTYTRLLGSEVAYCTVVVEYYK